MQRPNSKAQNALECFEHLNIQVDLYNNFFENALNNAPQTTNDLEIKSAYQENK